MKGLGGLIWSGFKQTYGPIITVVSFLLIFVPIDVLSTTTVSLRIALIVGLVALIVLLALGNVVYELYKVNSRALPKIVLVKPGIGVGAPFLCVLEPSDLFSHDSLVSMYFVEDNKLEQLIGFGVVRNIQGDGLIQVEINETYSKHSAVVDRIMQNNGGAWNKTLIKPVVTRAYLDVLAQRGP